jgi:hypothetical protein
MTAFDDDTPEDAWHPDDPFPVLAMNLLRRLALLDGGVTKHATVDVLDIIQARLAVHLRQRDDRSEPDKIRIDLLRQDLAYLRDRDG